MRTGARLPVVLRGYDRWQVDALLQRISQALDVGPPISLEEVRESAFRVVRLSPGYDEREVDRFLVQLAVALER